MSYEQAFTTLKDFLESKPASVQAISKLDRDKEIRLLIDGQIECALFNDGGNPKLEQRPAKNPDVEFTIFPEAIRLLETHPGENMAEFGIEVVKETFAGHVKIRVCGSFMGVMTGGYLGIIKEAGPEFTKFLAAHGLSGINRIIATIKSLKN